MGKVIAVTGGTGFIGSHLIERLVAEGYTTRCLVLPGERYDAVPGASYHVGDITDAASLGDFLQGIDTLVHLAGLTRARTEDDFCA